MRFLSSAAWVFMVVSGAVHANPAENDQAMVALATRAGCMHCHALLPTPRRADGLPPIAPAWRDIALRYRDDPRASERLSRTVVTGSNPAARHWTDKLGAATMPPNDADLSAAEARVLVNWILVLVP